jgi:hypothetical protein
MRGDPFRCKFSPIATHFVFYCSKYSKKLDGLDQNCVPARKISRQKILSPFQYLDFLTFGLLIKVQHGLPK